MNKILITFKNLVSIKVLFLIVTRVESDGKTRRLRYKQRYGRWSGARWKNNGYQNTLQPYIQLLTVKFSVVQIKVSTNWYAGIWMNEVQSVRQFCICACLTPHPSMPIWPKDCCDSIQISSMISTLMMSTTVT